MCLKNKQNQFEPTQHNLIHSGTTRWISIYMMLDYTNMCAIANVLADCIVTYTAMGNNLK